VSSALKSGGKKKPTSPMCNKPNKAEEEDKGGTKEEAEEDAKENEDETEKEDKEEEEDTRTREEKQAEAEVIRIKQTLKI
jgi:hypothetical protein